MYPISGPGARLVQAIFCCGKGGNKGGKYMMAAGIKLLKQQGFDGDNLHILMVGDRFDTDIAAGIMAGVRTCLVTSGCHQLDDQVAYPEFRPDFHAKSVADLVDLPSEAAAGAPEAAAVEQQVVALKRIDAEMEQADAALERGGAAPTAQLIREPLPSAGAAREADAAAPEGGGGAEWGGGGAE